MTRREAQIAEVRRVLESAGWDVRGVSSADGNRRPLLLPGERIGQLLDASRADERAQGFTARLGDAWIVVDACAGLPLEIQVGGIVKLGDPVVELTVNVIRSVLEQKPGNPAQLSGRCPCCAVDVARIREIARALRESGGWWARAANDPPVWEALERAIGEDGGDL